MKSVLLAILICLIPLTALAQQNNNSCEGCEKADASIQTSPQYSEEEKKDYQTKEDILQTYGEPFYKGGHKDVELWYYPEPYRMFIFFEGDEVVKIDVVAGKKI